MRLRINANKVFPHRNYRIVFKLQNTPYFSAKNENFLSLALSQAMCGAAGEVDWRGLSEGMTGEG